ncbi:hypothetical protein J23TS9_44230 [Paenibacillus sp. J23TS9]|uniref:hypothetical protein n=1 Tax=Paenibacillus sp. J23TS9 TaxID=2807193 RepID=UPI001B176008|nr:hypothetical protein [Paenibacillus sp. J23TS9]GIP29293.1 hypothetical protein J23TS9_44230 [Paenibacillus sp. J23TS9]
MKRVAVLMYIFFLFVHTEASASWAYPFVVYHSSVYVVTMEEVSSELIGNQIGKVTRFSDKEGTYRGNFSNQYPKGTPYYAINGIDSKQQIAVKTDAETYIKAVYQRTYAADETSKNNGLWWMYMIGAALLALVVLVAINRRSRRRQ